MSREDSSFCKVNVILISAKQGGGKTTLAREILKQIERLEIPKWRAVELSFAGTIYEMHDACRSILKSRGINPPHEVKDGNLLQLLGTEWGRRTIGENVWVDALKGQIENELQFATNCGASRLFVVVPDCRFRNEFDAFPDATRIRLVCDRRVRKQRVEMWRENEEHISETDLDQYSMEDKFDLLFETQVDRPEDISKDVIRAVLKKDSAPQQSGLQSQS